jgi:hypothetical protein
MSLAGGVQEPLKSLALARWYPPDRDRYSHLYAYQYPDDAKSAIESVESGGLSHHSI